MDVSELQSKLQVVAISKGKAPKKKGRVINFSNNLAISSHLYDKNGVCWSE